MSVTVKKSLKSFWSGLGILFAIWAFLLIPVCAGFGWRQGPLWALGVSCGVFFVIGGFAKTRVLKGLSASYGPLRAVSLSSKRVVFEASTPHPIVVVLRSPVAAPTVVISRGALLNGDFQQGSVDFGAIGSVPETIGIWFSMIWNRLVATDKNWSPGKAWLAGVLYPVWRWLNKIGLYRRSL